MKLDKVQKILENRVMVVSEAIRSAIASGDLERVVDLERELNETQNSINEIKAIIDSHNGL